MIFDFIIFNTNIILKMKRYPNQFIIRELFMRKMKHYVSKREERRKNLYLFLKL
jgi:hypothetical protein